MVVTVCASKIDDAEHEAVSISEASKFAKSVGGQLGQTSSKTGAGIEELFNKIAERLVIKNLQV